jgi:hypothetical protein
MSWIRVKINDNGQSEYQGVSTDGAKPTDCTSGSTCYELDTQKGHVFDADHTNPATNDNWWGVQ